MSEWTLITGASKGLGTEFARLAARNGRKMILTARSGDMLENLADELRGDGAEVVVIPADLSTLEDADRMWTEATDGRQVDFLINNAGLGSHAPFAQEDAWQRELSSINVNMVTLTQLMKRAVPHMKGHGRGRILNVASAAGFLPGPNMAVYSATKAYVLHLSEAVAHELRGSNVTVTAFCPGATQTNFFSDGNMQGARLLKLTPIAKADKVAAAGWQAAIGGRTVAVPGALNAVFANLPRVLPRGVITRVSGIFLGKD